MTDYFYDSYAIIEYLKGNKRYKKYFTEPWGITTRLNLMELYYTLLDDQEYADEMYSAFLLVTVEPEDEEVRHAMRLRRRLKEKGLNISYADAVGYAISQKRKLRFLTGDKAFKSLDNVEFVK